MVAGKTKLEAAAHGGPVDRGNPGLAGSFQPPVEQRELAALVEHHFRGGLLAFALEEVGKQRAMRSSMVRSAPPQKASLAEVITAPLIAASLATFSTICESSSVTRCVDDVHRAAGHIPGNERNSVGVDVDLEIRHRWPPQYGSPFFFV